MSEATEIYTALEEACVKKQFNTVEELLKKFAEIIAEEKKASQELYIKGIIKALTTFKGKFPVSKIRSFIENVEQIVKENPTHEELAISYAKILRSSLIAIKTKGQPYLMREIITDLENFAKNYPENVTIYEELSMASNEIINYWKKRGDYKALQEQSKKLREFAKKFPENETIQLQLSKSIVAEIGSIRKLDIGKIDKLLLEIQNLSESRPTNKGLQLEWVHAYRTAMDRSEEKPKDAKRWLESMKKIAGDKKDIAFRIELAKGYKNAIIVLGAKSEELKKLLAEFNALIDNTTPNVELYTVYAQTLLEALKIIGITNYQNTKEILGRLRKLLDDFPEAKPILNAYLESLVGIIGLLSNEKKGEEVYELLKSFEDLQQRFPKDKTVQLVYQQLTDILRMLGFKKQKRKNVRPEYL
ncbi:MAG: hypothetical protein ACTSXO_01630 [Candidatus Heimdallarchaeota archaeon]